MVVLITSTSSTRSRTGTSSTGGTGMSSTSSVAGFIVVVVSSQNSHLDSMLLLGVLRPWGLRDSGISTVYGSMCGLMVQIRHAGLHCT